MLVLLIILNVLRHVVMKLNVILNVIEMLFLVKKVSLYNLWVIQIVPVLVSPVTKDVLNVTIQSVNAK